MINRGKARSTVRWIAAITVAGAVMFFGVGAYLHDQQGRWNDLKGNLPSEMIGLAMGILAAVLVVGWIVEWHRQREWQLVKEHVAAAVTRHVADIASEYLAFLKIPDQGRLAMIAGGRHRPQSETLHALDSLVKQLKGLEPDHYQGAVCDLYEEVRWDLDRLASILLLRGLHAEDAQLAQAMSDVDARAADWHTAVVAEKHGRAMSCLPPAMAVLEALRELYAVALGAAAGNLPREHPLAD